MISIQTALTAYFLPDDATDVLQGIVAFIDSAGEGERLRICMYGFTNASFVDAILRAHARGVDCKLILDHSQSAGPAEVAQLHRLLLAGFPADNIRIGTSTQHQIIHMKVATIAGKDVPDGQFATWQDARKASYPCTIEGSFNWSGSASKQMNTVFIVPSKPLAAAILDIFDKQWEFLTTQEPQYQTLAS